MSLLQNIGPIGPSLGWLFAKLGSQPHDVQEYVSAALATSAEAIEFSIGEPERERRAAILALPVQDVDFLSLHLASFKGFPTLNRGFPDTWKQVFSEYGRLCRKHRFDVTIAHPDVTPPHVVEMLSSHDILVAIENMDANKQTGRTPNELFNFAVFATEWKPQWVLDVQHAYESALALGIPIEKFMRDMLDLMEGCITHLHVSGEIREGEIQKVQHAQLYVATNREAIFDCVRMALEQASSSLPIILEGESLLDLACGGPRLANDVRHSLLQRAIDEMRHDHDCLLDALCTD